MFAAHSLHPLSALLNVAHRAVHPRDVKKQQQNSSIHATIFQSAVVHWSQSSVGMTTSQ